MHQFFAGIMTVWYQSICVCRNLLLSVSLRQYRDQFSANKYKSSPNETLQLALCTTSSDVFEFGNCRVLEGRGVRGRVFRVSLSYFLSSVRQSSAATFRQYPQSSGYTLVKGVCSNYRK